MNPRRLLAVGIAVACVSAITYAFQYAGRTPTVHAGMALAQSPAVPGKIAQIWTIPVTGFRSASFSPDNSFFAIVGDPAGMVTLRHRSSGKSVWSEKMPMVTNVVVGPEGKCVIAFTAMDPTRQRITIIKGIHHEAQFPFVLDGAIWGATISADGSTAAVVTGGHSLYVFSLVGDAHVRPSQQRHALAGTGNSVAISRDGGFIASGTWADSGVVCVTAAGDPVWQYPDPAGNRLYEAQIAQSSPYVLGVSYANVQQSNAKLYLWTMKAHGHPIWTYSLGPDDSDPQVKIAANGSHVALAYLHKVMHGDQTIQERRLVMLDRYPADADTANVLWTWGGPLMSPNLVAISPDGNTITVTDGQRALYNFDANGKVSMRYGLSALIHDTVTSDDGNFVLVHTSDDYLTLITPA